MLKKMYKEAKEAIIDLGDVANEYSSKAYEKAVSAVDLKKVVDAFEDIGFYVSTVELSFTVPPVLSLDIDLKKTNIDQEKFEKILNGNGKSVSEILLRNTLKAIDTAKKTEEKINFQNRVLTGFTIEVSLMPTIKVRYDRI